MTLPPKQQAPVVRPAPVPVVRGSSVPPATRAALILCGASLMVGFFMPWLTVGELMSVSGLGLAFSNGQMVTMISGSHRFLLLAIPAVALLLVIGGIVGNRLAPWSAVIGGLVILGYGFFTVVRMFISSTGLGMWIVLGSVVLALAIGLVEIAGRSRRADRSSRSA
jgi:hypothetical protein